MRPRAALVVIAAFVALGGLYVLLRGTGSTAGSYQPQPRAYRLTLAGGKLAAGPSVLDATQGDPVTVAVTADSGGTLHLHGYEKSLTLEPGHEATLSFTAARAGWFPVGVHNPDGTEDMFAALQVQPSP